MILLSNLLNNPNLKSKKSDPLDRGKDIKPKNTFSVDDLVTPDLPQTKSKSETDRVTFYANVRINNHIKNKAEALSSIGLFKSQKDAISDALDYFIDSLPADDKRRYKLQLETLEERDVRIRNNKK